jgi:hypothetical protein
MKITLQIQVESAKDPHLVDLTDQAVRWVGEAGGVTQEPEFGEEDGGAYANVGADVTSLEDFWNRAKVLLNDTSNSEFRNRMMVMAEGAHGWNDYLLLHHFDLSVNLDDPKASSVGE